MDLPGIRARHNWTQADLARELGVSPGHVGDIERGHRRMTVALAAKLERATGEKGYVELVAAEIAAPVRKARKPKRSAA